MYLKPRPGSAYLTSLLLVASCSACLAQPSTPLTAPTQIAQRSPNLRSAQVVSTGDGDTLRVRTAGATQPIIVRLACVDALESDQPGGQAAASRLTQLLPRDVAVALRVVADCYGRTGRDDPP
ncbi:hypothetical protein H6F43_03745 [Leptolyngbya sp. FACHB-36]|uniref:thermonuclease family protein n=1 Tax=Leptolyngbya sp. FACHB-36 TaxID=2692808 RepID=UPI00168015B8|nr:hypothetical protein [Leptolyngbya sp. FACHB-36]MBD2019295.1 hypothetical protein [Leptolyngbya sp. FACHB-36]